MDSSTLEVGALIADRYRVLSVVGEGAAGVVYAVEHLQLQKKFALKTLRAEALSTPTIEERFKREALAIAKIEHRNVLRVTDFGSDPKLGEFMVAELVEGHTLDELQIELSEALNFIGQILEGLQAAHDLGIIHRDLKPANVMVVMQDGLPTIKILDFGLAKLAQDGSPNLTQAGTVFGTPRTMSPEQASGEHVDHRTDIYAVGVMLYELVSGRPPFDGDSVAEILIAQIEAPIPSLICGEAERAQLQPVVNTAMAKHAGERFATAAAFRVALEAAHAALSGNSDEAKPDRDDQDTAHSVDVIDRKERPKRPERMSSDTGAPPAALARPVSSAAPAPARTAAKTRLPIGWIAVALVLLAVVVVPVWFAANDPTNQAREALERGQVDHARALLLEARNAAPHDAEISMWQGHAALAAEDDEETCNAYVTAVGRQPSLVEDERLGGNIMSMVDRNVSCARTMVQRWVEAKAVDPSRLLVTIANQAKHSRDRKGAYEGLLTLDELGQLDAFDWLTAEMAKVSGAGCSVRRWYVRQLIALDDSDAVPLLERQLHAKDEFIGVFSRSRCMSGEIKKALEKWR